MAATTNLNPRRNEMAATAVNEELARLRAAVHTLADLVITGGLMDTAELAVLIGEDLVPADDADAELVTSVMHGAALPSAAAPVPLPPPSLPAPAPAATAVQAATMARMSFDAELDPHAIAAALSGEPVPSLKSPSVWSRLFGRRKTSAAAVAKGAASIEFTERMPKLPFGDKDGLYGDAQRPTELSFPPPSTVKRQRTRTPARSRSVAAASHAGSEPARFCERCWRRVDADGQCRGCGPSA
jgi:hypothetical protein